MAGTLGQTGLAVGSRVVNLPIGLIREPVALGRCRNLAGRSDEALVAARAVVVDEEDVAITVWIVGVTLVEPDDLRPFTGLTGDLAGHGSVGELPRL